jgi:hypothetical protein
MRKSLNYQETKIDAAFSYKFKFKSISVCKISFFLKSQTLLSQQNGIFMKNRKICETYFCITKYEIINLVLVILHFVKTRTNEPV